MDNHNIIEDNFHHYAYNDKDELVHLTKGMEVIRDDYRCIACGETMRPVMGEVRDWHFRHKTVNPDCNHESYLHQLAKKIIKKRFDESESFIVSYYVKEVCSNYDSCQKHSSSCTKVNRREVNLKEKYDMCEIEEKDSHFPFRADLKLSSKNHPNRKPVFLEIAYTHDCESEKINSGIQIIELKVSEDNDISSPLNEDLVMLDYTSGNPYQYGYLPKVRFFNFKRVEKSSSIFKKCVQYRYIKAKQSLVQSFYQSDTFFIQYSAIKKCPKYHGCKFACEACNKQIKTIRKDLKEIYDTCIEDEYGNLLLTKQNSAVPYTTIKCSFEGKASYEDGGQVIELLHYSDAEKTLREDLLNINMNRPNNPYDSVFQPSVRFYNFERVVCEECTIKLKRFVLTKDGGETDYKLLEDTDCRHIDNWPDNAIYGLVVPDVPDVFTSSYNLMTYGLMRAFVNGYKIYDCRFCKHCMENRGRCVHYGYNIRDLVSNNEINSIEESKKCNGFQIDISMCKQIVDLYKIPTIEWKRSFSL